MVWTSFYFKVCSAILLLVNHLMPNYQGIDTCFLGTPYLYFHGRLVSNFTFDNLENSPTNPLLLPGLLLVQQTGEDFQALILICIWRFQGRHSIIGFTKGAQYQRQELSPLASQ